MSHFPFLFPMPLSITFQKHSQGQQKRTTLIKVHKKEGKIVRFAGHVKNTIKCNWNAAHYCRQFQILNEDLPWSFARQRVLIL